ncbi:MAG: hypothetical protein AAFV33_18215, partial [Chloroflexota bacterium]
MRGFLNWIRQPVNVIGVLAGGVPLAYLVYFIQTFWINVPRADSLRSATIAFRASAGTLTVDDLLGGSIGHVTLPSFFLTLASVHLLDWNLKFEIAVNFTIALLTFALLMWLVWQTDRRIFPYVLFPASLLFFSVQQNLNWLIAYHGVWFQVQFLALMAVLLTIMIPNKRWAVLSGCMTAAVATFSLGAGAISWGMVLLTMVFNGFRKPAHYLAWLVATAISVGVYVWMAGVGIATEQVDGATLNLSDIPGSMVHGIAILGSPFAGDRVNTGIVVGSVAVGLLLLNMALLFFTTDKRTYYRLWLPVMAYSVAVALLIGLARGGQSLGRQSAMNSYYTTTTNFFYIGLIVSVALLVSRVIQRQTWWNYSAMVANFVFAAVLLTLFVPSNTTKLDKLWDRTRFEHEGCFMRILYIQDKDRIKAEDRDCELISQDAINHLSLFDLGMMAHRNPINILPPTFDGETPVLIEGDTGWGNYNVEKWLLADVNALHISPTAPDSPYTAIDFAFTPPGDDAVQTVLDRVDNGSGLWVVRRTELETAMPQLWAELDERGFVPTSYTYTTEYDVEFTVTRYERLDIDES